MRFAPVPAVDKPGWFRLRDYQTGEDLCGVYSTPNAALLAACRLQDREDARLLPATLQFNAVKWVSNCIRLGLLISICILQFSIFNLQSLPAAEPIAQKPAATQDDIDIYFSPRGGCTAAIVAELKTAKQTIDCQAYSFTSQPIAEALLAAKNRGVTVRVLLDNLQSQGSGNLTGWLDQRFELRADHKHAIAHNKILLIDGRTMITGSFNFTAHAETSNAENLLIVRGHDKLAQAYADNFELHWSHSLPR